MTLQISNKSATLKAIERINQTLSQESDWTKTGEAMTRTGQATSPTSNDARTFSLTGAIKRGVQEVGSSENWQSAQIMPFEQEVEQVFTSVLSERGYMPPSEASVAESYQGNPDHPGEMVLNHFNSQATGFSEVRELIQSAQERVINYSD